MIIMVRPLEVNLSGQWNTLWGTLKQAVPGLPTILGMLALILVVLAIVSWVWGRRRNITASNNQPLIGAIIVAAVFAAPDLVLPLLLTIVDGVANFVIRLAGNTIH
jgi:hypothetical protein